MPDMLTLLTPGVTKLVKDVEDVFKVRLLVIVHHIVHPVNLKPETGKVIIVQDTGHSETFLFYLLQLPGPLLCRACYRHSSQWSQGFHRHLPSVVQ